MVKENIYYQMGQLRLVYGTMERELIGLMNEVTKVNREKQTLKFYTILLLLTVNYTLEKQKNIN